MRLSVSSLRTFHACPLRWKWDKQDAPTSRPKYAGWRRGTAVHAGLEAAYAFARRTNHDAPMHHPSVISVATAAVYDSCLDGRLPREEWDDCLHQVIDHLMEAPHVAPHDILDVEGFVQFVVRRRQGEQEALQVIGFADRIDRIPPSGVRIVDYKARTSDLTATELANDLQAQIYTVAASHRFPWARRIEFRIDFTRTHDSVSITRDRDEVRWLERSLTPMLTQAETGMRDGPWPPTPGPHCDTCPFLERCPAHGHDPPAGDADGGPIYDPRMDGRNWHR